MDGSTRGLLHAPASRRRSPLVRRAGQSSTLASTPGSTPASTPASTLASTKREKTDVPCQWACSPRLRVSLHRRTRRTVQHMPRRSEPHSPSSIILATVVREQPVREAKAPAASSDPGNSSAHRAIWPPARCRFRLRPGTDLGTTRGRSGVAAHGFELGRGTRRGP